MRSFLRHALRNADVLSIHNSRHRQCSTVEFTHSITGCPETTQLSKWVGRGKRSRCTAFQFELGAQRYLSNDEQFLSATLTYCTLLLVQSLLTTLSKSTWKAVRQHVPIFSPRPILNGSFHRLSPFNSPYNSQSRSLRICFFGMSISQ